MIHFSWVRFGSKVYYCPKFYGENEFDNGMVKEVVDYKRVRVVYDCNNDWDNFEDYTSELTNVEDLHYGWRNILNED